MSMAELNSKSIVVFSPGDKNQLFIHTYIHTHTYISVSPLKSQWLLHAPHSLILKNTGFFYEE
jgi:hypothetical protein